MTHTSLVRWEPFLRDLDALAGRFDQLFDSSWRTAGRENFPSWYPPVDIYDTGTALVIEAEIPGFRQNELDIRVENDMLFLHGERARSSNGQNERGYVRAERCAGSFTRTFSLPASVDSERIEASYRDGLLTLTLPKSEAAIPRRIDVQDH